MTFFSAKCLKSSTCVFIGGEREMQWQREFKTHVRLAGKEQAGRGRLVSFLIMDGSMSRGSSAVTGITGLRSALVGRSRKCSIR